MSCETFRLATHWRLGKQRLELSNIPEPRDTSGMLDVIRVFSRLGKAEQEEWEEMARTEGMGAAYRRFGGQKELIQHDVDARIKAENEAIPVSFGLPLERVFSKSSI